MIESCYDITFVARLALREKQIQQNFRPVIAVHKWFARRPGSLFRALTLAEFLGQPVSQTYYGSHRLAGRKVADPFMGGGTPILEANRLGCDVEGFDINPMAWWVVSEEIKQIDLAAYRQAALALVANLRKSIGDLYMTRCVVDGRRDVPVKTFLWVKTCECERCGLRHDLFPGLLLAEDKRHPKNVVICAHCGELNEISDLKALGDCRACTNPLTLDGPVSRGHLNCTGCGHRQRFAQDRTAPLGHRLFAIEYYNPQCATPHGGRFFKKPDAEDIAKTEEAQKRLAKLEHRFIPDDAIPAGDESDRLHRWGYQRWRELFHPRQLLGLELSARLIDKQKDPRLKSALATNLSDLLRYQNSLCRYDTMALKVLDIFSVHGFPVGLVSAEANLLGIAGDKAAPVGSGGWGNILTKYAKAKEYCETPFEIRYDGRKKITVPSTEWIGEARNGTRPLESRQTRLHCRNSTNVLFPPRTLDAVFTDPPYFGNVQYSELMDFCYVWLRRLVGKDTPCFGPTTTCHENEVVGNESAGRGLAIFSERLGKTWTSMARGLKDGAPLAFTFHHNDVQAYAAVSAAILDSGLVCSASLPCPAEMSGSVHIHGTASSIIDTIFVCRQHGQTKRRWLVDNLSALVSLVREELDLLADAGVEPTLGDARCVLLGHLSRLAVWSLRATWDRRKSQSARIARVSEWMNGLGHWENELRALDLAKVRGKSDMPLFVQETKIEEDYASF